MLCEKEILNGRRQSHKLKLKKKLQAENAFDFVDFQNFMNIKLCASLKFRPKHANSAILEIIHGANNPKLSDKNLEKK